MSGTLQLFLLASGGAFEVLTLTLSHQTAQLQDLFELVQLVSRSLVLHKGVLESPFLESDFLCCVQDILICRSNISSKPSENVWFYFNCDVTISRTL